MKIGVVVPQGWFMEYRGRDPRSAWAQTVAVAMPRRSRSTSSDHTDAPLTVTPFERR